MQEKIGTGVILIASLPMLSMILKMARAMVARFYGYFE
jgi:hypothetical protein